MVRYWLYFSMIFIVESCFILKINYTYECIKWIRSLLARIKYIEIRLWPAYYNTCAFCVNKLFIAYAVNCIHDIFYHIRYTYMWKKYYIMQTNISIHYIRTNLCTHNKFISTYKCIPLNWLFIYDLLDHKTLHSTFCVHRRKRQPKTRRNMGKNTLYIFPLSPASRGVMLTEKALGLTLTHV